MNKPIYKHFYWSSLILKLKAGWFLAAAIYIYIYIYIYMKMKKFKWCIWVVYKMNLYFCWSILILKEMLYGNPILNNLIIPFQKLKLICKWIGSTDVNIFIV
jgi:hypothetical protein